ALMHRVLAYTTPDAFSEPEQLLAAFFGASNVGFCIVDRDLSYLAINNALATINGMPAAGHLSRTVSEIFGGFAAKIEPNFRRVLATGQPILNLEVSGVLPSRVEVGHGMAHDFPILDQNGHVKQVGALVVDTTKPKVLEQETETFPNKLNKEKAAHE